ncbi:cohesin subunit SMC1 KNAG_0G00910 [Huiozyma naganishii CBS 8797]|uniref:Structural maintenance of chromosomes protein n=1 Tax=Huiozyma naganishii (strain ATCC MYA-139 / BCRC 22969 / CBS 8797 / KCTC 17520 / NBRC 10181 / NCYC 3082 / Yp74L-3) TaxID=1071383 RepID=J7S0T3_HUIN7|nr:hypothetical protein KNAG_0G00910 [Kazachstania naganishii CBS 8797]CCK71147.1 hypothetical protein KNAG_0G00910 [Kazachstania naganishii CBS 8797]
MGRLLGLELYNFKSYRGVVKVGFGESNFTSIIGPNGSGKSNMMDAISFVLGVRSSYLRSSAVADLIYRGVVPEEEDDGEGEGDGDAHRAYVSAFYSKGPQESTVELKRTISKNGDSTYQIDRRQVTYKQYSEFLESQNILIKAKNFLVFQGDVEQVASQSPLQLTKLFEEVSGSAQYKKEYDLLKDQLEQLSHSATESIKDRRRVHSELKSYREGVSKDEEYKKNLENKKELEKIFAMWKLYHLQMGKDKLLADMANTESTMSKLRKEIRTREATLQKSKASFASETAALLKLKNKLDYKVRDREKVLSDIRLIKLPQRATANRIRNIEKRIDLLQNELRRQESYVARFETQLEVATKTKVSFEAELKRTAGDENRYRLTDADLALYQELMGKYLSEGNGSTIEEKLALLLNDKQEVDDELDRYYRMTDVAKSRINEELQVNLEKIEMQATELSSSLNEKNALNAENLKELKNLQSEIESRGKQEYDLNYKLRETLVKIDELSANQRETVRERKLRENVVSLKRLFPGVKGIVSDLCHPKKDKYSVSVATVLGKNFDSVIVDSLSVAQECIAYLKKQRAGVISFIPLDTVDSAVATLPSVNIQGYLLAKNAMEYESQYERAINYVCGDAIICDTLDLAKKLKWDHGFKNKLIALDGSLIHRAGLMTGGISKDGNNRWDKEEYQSLMTLKDKILQQIEDTAAYGRSASIQARELESNISLLNAEIASIRTQLTQINRSIEENKVEINHQIHLVDKEYSPMILSLKKKKESILKQSNELTEEKDRVQVVIFKAFTDKVGFSVRDYESHSGEVMRQNAKELQQLQKEILTVENKLQFERERLESTRGRLLKAEEDIKKAQLELSLLEEQEKKYHTQIKPLEEDICSFEKQIEEKETEIEGKKLEINNKEESLNEVQSSVEAVKRQHDEISTDIENLDLERIGILRNCKISNRDLPILSETNLADVPITSNEQGDAIKMSNEIDIDYEELPTKYKESSSKQLEKELTRSIEEVNEMLEILQPNARAVGRFDEAQERFNAIDNETERLKSEERKIYAQFLKTKKKRKELFDRAFDYVSTHIDGIYRELTKDPNSTAELAGGSASLTLEDEDEPFNAGIKYHATPPLKRFKDMEYLSGGEKTVAALALLFAINSYQPSPFFVLDEIDAALDIKNVERIAAYIRKHGNPSLQFIVISLKNSMFEKSDALVGVYRRQQENSSRLVTLDLGKYAD